MTNAEICDSFRRADNKRQQIGILAELTATDKETVAEVLADAGLYVKECRCAKCGKPFRRIYSTTCRECADKKARREMRKVGRRTWIRYQIAENEVRRQSLLRQAALIQAENERLREVMG